VLLLDRMKLLLECLLVHRGLLVELLLRIALLSTKLLRLVGVLGHWVESLGLGRWVVGSLLSRLKLFLIRRDRCSILRSLFLSHFELLEGVHAWFDKQRYNNGRYRYGGGSFLEGIRSTTHKVQTRVQKRFIVDYQLL
jgi:hypothetical protein